MEHPIFNSVHAAKLLYVRMQAVNMIPRIWKKTQE